MTLGTVEGETVRVPFALMATIATITSCGAIICGIALIGLLWRVAERADNAELQHWRRAAQWSKRQK